MEKGQELGRRLLEEINRILEETGFGEETEPDSGIKPLTYAGEIRAQTEGNFIIAGGIAGAVLGGVLTFILSEPFKLEPNTFLTITSFLFKVSILTPLGAIIGTAVGVVDGWVADRINEKILSRFS